MEKANEIITANQISQTYTQDDKGHTLEQYSYDHYRLVGLFLLVFLCFLNLRIKGVQKVFKNQINKKMYIHILEHFFRVIFKKTFLSGL